MIDTSTNDSTTPQTSELLRRILDAVEQGQRKRWVEIVCAIVLALATTASAWCAYQSSRWGGVQTFKLAAAAKAAREASKYDVEAVDIKVFDGLMFIHYIEQRGSGNHQVEEFLLQRFRPDMKVAMDAWLATDPFNNPNAPQTPFVMSQYVQSQRKEAEHFHAESLKLHEEAQHANENSDRYVLLTVLFAAVLFFGGISGTISNDSRRLRWAMQFMSFLLFLSISAYLTTMPLCRD